MRKRAVGRAGVLCEPHVLPLVIAYSIAVALVTLRYSLVIIVLTRERARIVGRAASVCQTPRAPLFNVGRCPVCASSKKSLLFQFISQPHQTPRRWSTFCRASMGLPKAQLDTQTDVHHKQKYTQGGMGQRLHINFDTC